LQSLAEEVKFADVHLLRMSLFLKFLDCHLHALQQEDGFTRGNHVRLRGVGGIDFLALNAIDSEPVEHYFPKVDVIHMGCIRQILTKGRQLHKFFEFCRY